jgi:hypothetical protein
MIEHVIELNSRDEPHLNLSSNVSGSFLRIDQQPNGSPPVTANKYIEPPFVLQLTEISLFPLARQGLLRVSAKLFFTLTDQPANTTLDGRQDLLQGQLTVPVLSDGSATFSKLKIVEVSSRHRHQSFTISFQLEQMDPCNSHLIIPLGKSVKSLPLHVQSRVPKRKRLPSEVRQTETVREVSPQQQSCESSPQSQGCPPQEDTRIRPPTKRVRAREHGHGIASGSGAVDNAASESHGNNSTEDDATTNSLRLNLWAMNNTSSLENSLNSETINTASDNSNPTSSATTPSPRSPRTTYIDITDLLTLPQKEAAAKLGISESMLCKRFKECTRRKWPYRYVRTL